jgi:hypothetical protein
VGQSVLRSRITATARVPVVVVRVCVQSEDEQHPSWYRNGQSDCPRRVGLHCNRYRWIDHVAQKDWLSTETIDRLKGIHLLR